MTVLVAEESKHGVVDVEGQYIFPIWPDELQIAWDALIVPDEILQPSAAKTVNGVEVVPKLEAKTQMSSSTGVGGGGDDDGGGDGVASMVSKLSMEGEIFAELLLV